MINISVVILHYIVSDETIKCIDSIKKCQTQNFNLNIVVVDNKSPNDSGKFLKEKYVNDEMIDVILLDENLGFAKGNNAGYRFALERYNPDFIILSNNDIVIEQKSFFINMLNVYDETKFDVCAPDIYAPYKNVHQNPFRTKGYTKKELIEKKHKYHHQLQKFKILKFFHLYNFLHACKQLFRKKIGSFTYESTRMFDIVPNGAFLILSKGYIKNFSKGLFDGTFMYLEEGILHYLCNRKELTIVYEPLLKIIHNEGASTRSKSNSRVNKAIFEYTNTINSIDVFLNYLEELENEK